MTTDMAPPPHRHRVVVHDGQNGRDGGAMSVPGGGPELRKQQKRPHPRFSPSDRPQGSKSVPMPLKGPGAAGRPPVRAPGSSVRTSVRNLSGVCPEGLVICLGDRPGTDPRQTTDSSPDLARGVAGPREDVRMRIYGNQPGEPDDTVPGHR